MPGNEYQFRTEWTIPGDIEDVSAILEDIEAFPRWCPTVYLAIDMVDRGDAEGVGKHVKVLSKGKLPYKLRWAFTVIQSRKPNGFTIEATGDFVGTGVWTLIQEGSNVKVVYDWRIRADKALVRVLSPFLKPVFRQNHLWAMRQTELGLLEELTRRATT